MSNLMGFLAFLFLLCSLFFFSSGVPLFLFLFVFLFVFCLFCFLFVFCCLKTFQQQRLMEETYLERYMSDISSLTFKSTYVSFPPKLCSSVFQYHNLWKQQQEKQSDTTALSSWKEDSLLIKLAQEIDQARKIHLSDYPYMFVRLSSRSPKDSAVFSPVFLEAYHSQLEKGKCDSK